MFQALSYGYRQSKRDDDDEVSVVIKLLRKDENDNKLYIIRGYIGQVKCIDPIVLGTSGFDHIVRLRLMNNWKENRAVPEIAAKAEGWCLRVRKNLHMSMTVPWSGESEPPVNKLSPMTLYFNRQLYVEQTL